MQTYQEPLPCAGLFVSRAGSSEFAIEVDLSNPTTVRTLYVPEFPASLQTQAVTLNSAGRLVSK